MQIHELNNYLGDLGSDAYVAVDNGQDTGKLSVEGLTRDVDGKIDAVERDLNSRIDNIIGGGTAPSAAEVTDARLGANGTTYPTLGDAIRGQVEGLENDILTSNSIIQNNETEIALSWENGALSGGDPVASGYSQRTKDFIRLNGSPSVTLIAENKTRPGLVLYLAEYDQNKTYLGYTQRLGIGKISPSKEGSVYVKFWTYSETTPQADQGSYISALFENNQSIEAIEDDLIAGDKKAEAFTGWVIGNGVDLYLNRYEINANLNNDGDSTYIYKTVIPNTKINGPLIISVDSIENAIRANPIQLTVLDENDVSIAQKFYQAGKHIYIPPANADHYRLTLYPSITGGLTNTSAYYNNVVVINSGFNNIPINNKILKESGTIPGYYFENSYIQNKLSTLRTLINDSDGNYDAFVYCTDQHWSLNAQRSPDLIAYIMRNMKMPRLFMGGDYDSGIDLPGINAFRDGFKGHIYDIVGNHEYQNYIRYDYSDGPEALTVTGTMIWAYLNAKMTDCVIGSAERNYYYVDNQPQKMRYIVLNDWAEGPVYQFEQTQIDWFDSALADMPSGYTAVVFIHAISSVDHDTGDLLKNYAYNDVQAVVDQYVGKVAAVFGGHTHFDGMGKTDGGVPVFVTTCDKYIPLVGDDDYLTDKRTVGTITEQAFDIVVIDKKNTLVSAVRIGCPADNPGGSALEVRQQTY